MQVSLDLNKPFHCRPSFAMNLARPTEELLQKKINTRQLNLIKNGLASKGNSSQKVLIEEFPDLTLLSKIDFDKLKGNFETIELARGRSLDEVVKKLISIAKS